MTHFVSGNRSRETGWRETGKAAAALIPPTGSVKSVFHKGCSSDEPTRVTNWALGALNNILCMASATELYLLNWPDKKGVCSELKEDSGFNLGPVTLATILLSYSSKR